MPISGLTPDDAELLVAVASDLTFLEKEWDATIDEHSLRRSSTVLRNLLVNEAFARARRIAQLPGEAQLEAVDLVAAVRGLQWDKIVFAAGGGGTSGGAQVAGALVYSEAMDEDTIKARHEAMSDGPPRRRFRLSEFLASPTIIVSGETVSRRLVIKFVANKKGGAHFDFGRKKDEAGYRLLDEAMGYGLVDKRAVYFELLSIGQAFAQSAAARELREVLA